MLRLASALFCVVLFVLGYGAAHVGVIADADLRVLEGFMGLPGHGFAFDLVTMFDPAPYAVLSLSLVAGAVVARRPRAAAAARVTVVGGGGGAGDDARRRRHDAAPQAAAGLPARLSARPLHGPGGIPERAHHRGHE